MIFFFLFKTYLQHADNNRKQKHELFINLFKDMSLEETKKFHMQRQKQKEERSKFLARFRLLRVRKV
jgi:hypothetical protein